MNLEEVIAALEKLNPALIAPFGFHNPHSWRGSYYELAFEPTKNISVGNMLDAARSALGTTYEGYKGGDFKMGPTSDVHIANEGSSESLGLELYFGVLAMQFGVPELLPLAPPITTESSHKLGLSIKVKVSLGIGLNGCTQTDVLTVEVPDNYREMSPEEQQDILDDTYKDWSSNYIDGYAVEVTEGNDE